MGIRGKLKALTVERAKRPGMYADGGGLYLQVTSRPDRSGQARISKSWVFRYWVSQRDAATGELVRDAETGKVIGRTREMGLGSFKDVSLEEARAARDDIAKRPVGLDPIEAREQAARRAAIEKAKEITFEQAARSFIASKSAEWKNKKHAAQWSMTLLGETPDGRPTKESYCATLHKVPVRTIDVSLVQSALEPIWETKHETASRVRGRVETVLDWATVRGHRKDAAGQDMPNPARWQGNLKLLLAAPEAVRETENQPSLPYEQLPAFLIALRKQQGIAARALEYTILTAARTSETLGAVPAEISETDKMWTIPPHRMKRKREHRVPLTATALAIVAEMKKHPDGDKFIFPGGKHGQKLSDNAMASVLDRMNADAKARGEAEWMDPKLDRPAVPHGFRSSFRDWAEECADDIPEPVRELALSHHISDKTLAAYRRTDLVAKRRALMERWEAYCLGIERPAANVVHFPEQSRVGA